MASAYGITAQDLLQRLELEQLKKITLDAPPYSGDPDWTVVDAKIAEAEADVHVAASSYYATPIAPRDDATTVEADELKAFIVGKVLDITMYKLLQRRPSLLNAGDRSTYYSGVKKAIDKWLEQIAGDAAAERKTIGVARERTVQITSSAGAWAESEATRTTLRTGGFV